ncbi:MAG: succinylglutamate desuccinylase/aspartoacylase family protein [Candidatus Hodarchaeales archaeon]|jgi:predicted deacylase
MNLISDFDSFLEGKGTKKSGWLPVSTRSDGSPFGIPVSIIIGKEEGPSLLVEACCHGDETEGAMAVVKLMKDLPPEKLKGTIIGVPVLNIRAYEAGTRGNPDERYNYDMNRLFPGDANGSVSQRVVSVYFNQIVKKMNVVVSLHGGGGLFYLINRVMVSTDPRSVELAKAMGPEWKLLHESSHPKTLLVECENENIPCVIAELGGSNNRLSEPLMKNVNCFTQTVKNLLIHQGMLEGTANYASEWGVLKGTNVKCKFGGLIMPTEKCKLNTEVKEGDHIVTIVDLFGEVLDKVLAPQDGKILGVPASPVAYPGNNILTIARVSKSI